MADEIAVSDGNEYDEGRPMPAFRYSNEKLLKFWNWRDR